MGSDKKNKVYIIPCSGIGKTFGSISRAAAHLVVNQLAKDKTEIQSLPLIVKGNKEVIDKLKDSKIITIDGCTSKCASQDTLNSVGKVDDSVLVLDLIRENRDLKPERSIYPIGEKAKKLSNKIAERVIEKIKEMDNGE
ncbi:MAG: putative zinc-binding protein [Promethearchaeota archaeon]